jgi:polyphenol oxidase
MSHAESGSKFGGTLGGTRRPSRRDVLAGAGAAVGALALPGLRLGGNAVHADHPQPGGHDNTKVMPFAFGKEPARVRKSFHDLTDDELRLLCLAVGYMRNGSRDKPLAVDHPLQWDRFALTHAQHCTEAEQGHAPQVHWSWFFLPWHRAYLFFLERTLAHFLTTIYKEDGSKFALPYWDWETHKEVPNTREREQAQPPRPSPLFGYDPSIDALSDPLQVHGHAFDNLALWDGYRGPTPTRPEMKPDNEQGPVWKQHTQMTAFYTDPGYINSILQFPFEAFGGGPVISRDDGQGFLEQFPHNFVHDWAGSRHGSNRDMGTLRYAALDPLFYLHHANIDRIWSFYRYTPDPNATPEWGQQAFRFTDLDGQSVSVTVTDVVKKMTTVSYAPPLAPAPGARVLLAAAPKFPREPPRESSATVVAKPTALTAQPLTLTAPDGTPEVGGLLARVAAREKPALALLEFDLGPIAYSGRFTVRVFANKPDATLQTSVNDPHFVGALEALDAQARGGPGEEKASHKFRVNVSKDVSNFANVVRPGAAFTLTLVPVGTAASLKNFQLTVKSVKLTVYHQE